MAKVNINLRLKPEIANRLAIFVDAAKENVKGPERVSRHGCVQYLLVKGLESVEKESRTQGKKDV